MVDIGRAVRVRHGLALPRRNPLDYWHHASPGTEKVTRALVGIPEALVLGGNKSGKTNYGAAVGVALAQGRTELDGIPIPRLDKRVVGAVLSLDHQQQALSVQPAYLSMLGDWPHIVGYKSRSQDIVGTIRIRQVDGSDDPRTWSVIHFISQENPNALTGARLHFAHADEPPKEHIWNEARARGFANKPFIRLITCTPLVRRQWMPLKTWFPLEYEGEVHNDRIVVRVPVYDNRYLTDEEKARLEDDYRDDPLRDARLNGDYIDATGKCPFDQKVILHLLEKSRPPRVVKWPVKTDSGTVEADVEVWEEPDHKESYYVPVDASAGIADSLHDPAGFHVWARGKVRLVARYNGYLPAYDIGTLVAAVAKKYNRALVDPETTGGWGVGVIKSLEQAGYGNIARQPRQLRPGEWEDSLGFTTTDASRPAMISAIQDFLRSVRDGRDLAQLPSADVLRCWQDVILNEKNKPIAAPGLHDEDMILAGQALRKLTHRGAEAVNRPENRRVVTLADLFGRPKAHINRMVIRLRNPSS